MSEFEARALLNGLKLMMRLLAQRLHLFAYSVRVVNESCGECLSTATPQVRDVCIEHPRVEGGYDDSKGQWSEHELRVDKDSRVDGLAECQG